MILWNAETINNVQYDISTMYRKLAEYKPDDKLSSGDIDKIMFLLRSFDRELRAVETQRKTEAEKKARAEAKKLTEYETAVLDNVTLSAIANGNTISPKAFDPSPAEYYALHQIRIKLDLNK